jgi:hypothetical protein
MSTLEKIKYAEELQRAWKNARSIPTGKEFKKGEYIGNIQKDNRVYLFYKQSEGEYWYEVMVGNYEGLKTEYESIFGKKELRRWRNKGEHKN